jgi:hypothetical protein
MSCDPCTYTVTAYERTVPVIRLCELLVYMLCFVICDVFAGVFLYYVT